MARLLLAALPTGEEGRLASGEHGPFLAIDDWQQAQQEMYRGDAGGGFHGTTAAKASTVRLGRTPARCW